MQRIEKVNPRFFAKRKTLHKRDVYRIAIGMMAASRYELVDTLAAPNDDKNRDFLNLNYQGEEYWCEYARLYRDNFGKIHIVYFPGTDLTARQRIAERSGDIDLETVKSKAVELIRQKDPNFDLAQAHQHFFIAESREYETIPKVAKHYVYGYLQNHVLTIEDSTDFLKYNTDGMVHAISQGEAEKLQVNPTIHRGDQSVLSDTCGHFVTEYFIRNVERISNPAAMSENGMTITDQKLTEAAFYRQQHDPKKYKELYRDDGYFARHYIFKNILLVGLIAIGIGGIAVAAVSSFGLLPALALIVGAAVGGALVATGGGLKLFDVLRRFFIGSKLKDALLKEDILDIASTNSKVNKALGAGKDDHSGHNHDAEDDFCIINSEDEDDQKENKQKENKQKEEIQNDAGEQSNDLDGDPLALR